MQENIQQSSTAEVIGKQLVTHHTKTWDMRYRLDSVADLARNLQISTTETEDAVGGWLVIHNTQTWDTMQQATDVDAQLQDKLAALQKAQAEYDALAAEKAKIKP